MQMAKEKKAKKEKKELVISPELSIPVRIIHGAYPGKTLTVTAGVHGNEYVGILACRHIWEELSADAMHGNLILLPLVNAQGFYAGEKQLVPVDGKNLNREFPGNPTGTLTQRMAYEIEKNIYPQSDFILDLHGGDSFEELTPLIFFPCAAGETIMEETRAAANALDIPMRVRSTAKNGLYSWATQQGIPAMLLERGCRGTWTKEQVEADVQDVYRLMRHMGILQDDAKLQNNAKAEKAEVMKEELTKNEPIKKEKNRGLITQIELAHTVYEESETDGFWYCTPKAGERIYAGQVIGELRDFEGNLIREYHAKADAIVMYKTVALGVRAGDPLIAYGWE